jgi:hypothetical protein
LKAGWYADGLKKSAVERALKSMDEPRYALGASNSCSGSVFTDGFG